jgi:hypothetical protein
MCLLTTATAATTTTDTVTTTTTADERFKLAPLELLAADYRTYPAPAPAPAPAPTTPTRPHTHVATTSAIWATNAPFKVDADDKHRASQPYP